MAAFRRSMGHFVDECVSLYLIWTGCDCYDSTPSITEAATVTSGHTDTALRETFTEVRRTFGSLLRLREQSRDARIVAWLDCVRADLVFGWRQLLKRKITTAAAVLSLALAIGACIVNQTFVKTFLGFRKSPRRHTLCHLGLGNQPLVSG